VSILLVIASAFAAALYMLAWFRAGRPTVADGETAPATGSAPPPAGAVDGGSLLLLAGVAVHALALYVSMATDTGFRFGFAQALSATFWVGTVMLWFEGLSVRVEALRSVVLPIAALTSLLPLVFPGSDFSSESTRPLFLPHLLVGTLAYGILMLAALHATLMTAAERALHGSDGNSASLFSRWLDRLPPLLVLERILFRFIAVGFVLLTLTAISGILFSEEVFGRPLTLDHKTVFTLISWALFAVLLVGRRLRGWRGRTALRLTLAGFAVLLLAYVGTRFVLEVILHRG
jgi:ABC-type uncharacterized transport system permease subunit